MTGASMTREHVVGEPRHGVLDVDTDLITLSRHVHHEQMQAGSKASGALTMLLQSIQLSCKFVSMHVRRAGLANLTGLTNEVNVQGEEVKKLDVLANSTFINALRSSGQVGLMISEENEKEIHVEDKCSGRYCVVFDPLDGSSNIDAGVSIGSIFGIYKIQDSSQGAGLSDVLRPGKEMIAAGYAMYGSFTTLVLSTGNGVNGYTLDPIQVPSRGKIYSINEGNALHWDEPTQKYIGSLKFPSKGAPYSGRYVGSMVSDVHRTLLYGGIFGYPGDKKSPKGKLRLLYECKPMAFLLEQAGGLATDGHQRILDIIPRQIHERSPIWLGSRDDVQDLIAIFQKYPSA